MTAPLEVEGAATEARPEAVLEGVGKQVEGRSLGQIAWMRLKRDRVALAGGCMVILLIFTAVFAPLLIKLFGHPIDESHHDQVDPNLGGMPKGPFGGISGDFLLGVEPSTGYDVFSRIVYGARVSFLVAFLATLVAVVIGVTLGVVAGYFGGWIDNFVSRVMDLLLAFPLLFFAIALVTSVPGNLFGLTGNGLRVSILVVIIGFFSWPYIGRIVRGQTFSLREREFVDAARSMGARNPYILFKEILPNLVAPILVYSTLIIPTNILFEAALSYLGVGIQPPTPSWGKMLAEATQFFEVNPTFMIIPGTALFLTVLSFNLFGDGLRDALDPRSR
jgi:ABC-type dipeptide/oligopeptide/nickel transport system permease subunit